MKHAAIQAETKVNVSSAQARQWFLELESHPERYRFESHAGFAFSEGDFGQTGARFQTWEQLAGIRLNLHFELTDIDETRFQFRLIRPPLPIWCAFAIQESAENAIALRLDIGGITRVGDWFLRCPIVRGAIQQQIRGEVDHIKSSMESLYG